MRPTTKRLAAASATLLFGGALFAAAGGIASAQPLKSATTQPATVTLAPITHPQSDTMGSTIRAHEQVTSSSSSSSSGMMPQLRAASVGPPYGMDVSNYQGNIDWPAQKALGASFVYIKATESTTYQNSYFGQQYNGAYAAGLLRGAYHFALPDRSSGATQALYFLAHGGGWSADGHTLPPMLDLEYNPYGSTCFNLTPAQLVAWVKDFSQTMYAHTGRYPVIYTTENYWDSCTGYNATFGATNPLFIARYATYVGPMPAGWTYQSLWQYNDHGTFPGDADVFNGSMTQLQTFAGQPQTVPPPPVVSSTDPVDVYYTRIGGQNSYLGKPTSSTYAVTGGEARNFLRGRIYYSPATGAHLVIGAILGHYLALGGPDSVLRLPTTDEMRTPDGIGRYNHFAGTGGSSIYWTPTTGAHQVQGAIAQRWAALGWERGVLGYPTTDETGTPGPSGRYNNFTGGRISWSRGTGAHEIHGAIGHVYAVNRFEAGPLGFPTSDEYSVSGGRRSNFQHGAITWTAATRATVVTLS